MPYIAISIAVLAIIMLIAFYIGKKYMKEEVKKENRIMFWTGMAMVAIAIIFFLAIKGEYENKIWAVPIWMMGIGLIAGSRYRLIK